MILLLDAHALLWWLTDDPGLARDADAAIRQPANDVVISVASIWELEIKRASGKLRPPEELIDAVEREGMSVVPITGVDAVAAAALPLHHRDPFHRILVAQAQRLDATIVTRDAAFAAYEVDVLAA